MIAALGSGVIAYRLTNAYGISRVHQHSASQATTILALTNSYVSTYSALRQSYSQNGLPVPASFRADALAHFDRTTPTDGLVNTNMVGMPDREIETAATDSTMRKQLYEMSSTNYVMTSSLVTARKTIHRTLFLSIASNQGCVECHNKLQSKTGDNRWKQGDLMRAYAVDRYIEPELALLKQSSFVFAILASLFMRYFVTSPDYS